MVLQTAETFDQHQIRTLVPKIERLIHNNGLESELLVLAGTVAITYQGRQYNIPVEIYVSEPYPDAPPRCYVRPTKDMDIKMGHRHVDREGLVYLPYLHEWGARSHNLAELCAAMSSVFGIDPPVYAVRKPSANPTTAQPNAYAMGPGPNRIPASPQNRIQPPPSYNTVVRPGMESSPQAQTETRKRDAIQQLTSKTQAALEQFYGRVKAELLEEQEREEKLKDGRREIATSIAQLRKLKEEMVGRISTLADKETQLDSWLKERSGKPQIQIDDVVEAADPPSRQMLDLVAQNGALEDALYHLDKAVANNTIDLPSFLKKVRDLSREQFLCVAHVNKIWRQQQIYIVANRADGAVSPPRS